MDTNKFTSGLTAEGTSIYEWELWRGGKLFKQGDTHNVTTTEGFNYLLQTGLGNGTAEPTWYTLIFVDDYTPLLTDTYAVPGFTEADSEYSETTRPTWTDDAAAGGSIANSSTAAFSIIATATIYGAALVSNNTKADVAAGGEVMYGAAKFTAGLPVENGDTLKVRITVTLQNV